MRARFIAAVVLGCLLAAPLLSAQAQSPATSQQQLQQQLHRSGRKLAVIRGTLAQVQARLDRAQAGLQAEQSRLASLQQQLRDAQAHLVRLEERLRVADVALTQNLVGQYEGTKPSLIGVVLSSRGFADLLERATFLKRVQHRDDQVILAARDARVQVTQEATKLGQLTVRAQRTTKALLARRNEIDRLRLALAAREAKVAAVHSRAAAKLAAVRAKLQADLAAVQRRQNALLGPAPTGADLRSGGGFVFPMPASAASPPGTWSLDQGVDISAPGHTPLLAVGSGTVVLHGIGGFGAWAPVLHLDDGRFIYYGHAGPGGQVPIGTHVGAGQVIGEVGAGIVGISTGPHLEIGFSDASGTPSGGAGTMSALLHASYGG